MPARSSGSASMQRNLISRTAGGPDEAVVPVGTNAIAHHPDQVVEAEIFTPGALASAANQASSTVVSAARSAFRGTMRAKGCTLGELTTAATALGGKYVPSHSAGAKLFSLNDHDGVLVVPFPNRGMTITEHLAVVKDTLPGANGTLQSCYFVKGYGSRLVGVDEALTGFSAQAHDSKPDAQRMETSFRTHLLELSKAAPLAARRSVHESNRPVMPVPPNAMEMPRRNVWANAENYMSKGCGGRPINSAGVPSDFDALHLDFNPIEGRILIFMPGPEQHDKVHPTQIRNGKTVPASVNIEGSVVAELQGILSVEVMGPRGTPGVKMAGLHNLRGMLHKGTTDGHLHLRIATEDGAIHELKQNPNGLKMRLVAPKEPGVGLLAPLDTAQTSLYTYQGRNTGLYGSIAGHANPQLVLSTGEALLAGPLMIDRASMKGQLRAAAKMTAGVMLLQPTLGARDSRLAAPLRTVLVAAATTAMVVGMAAMINTLRDPKTHTLLAGARPFSTAGAGLVSLPKLAGAIAVMVLAQNALSWVFDKLYDHGMKDVWKSKEKASLQFVNELLLPMTGEFLRLAVNYGTQKGLGLPRGDGIDVSTLLGVAGMLTVSRAVIGRSGQPENHPKAKVVAHTVDFFIGDLMFRALGAVAGNKDLRANMRAIDYAEAFLTRLGTRALDKWVAPLVATGLSAAGLLGSSATAYDDEISREARVSGLVMALQDLATHFSLVGDKLLFKCKHKAVADIELLAAGIKGTANLIESSHKAWNRAGINPLDANPLELQRVQNAVAFSDMSEDQQAEHLESMAAQFEAMIEATKLPDEGEGAPLSGPAPATAAAAGAPAADRHSPEATAVANSISQLPEAMKPLISELMTSFADKYDPQGGSRYPTMVAPDLLSVSLPHNAVANKRMGGKTDRILQDMTTFSGAPAEHIKKVHDAMASARGMPEEVWHSRKPYKELTPASLRAIETATVKYTQESGFFHYLLRWSQTGQSHFTEVVPGVHIETEMMNKRGNINGDIDRQISPADPLWINLGAVHADKFNALVQRAVVTDVPYYDAAPADGGVKPITEGQRISLTEILSTTSAETLAAAFLAALGYGATGNERNLRIVLKQDTAVNIAKHTELMQAETISMPGGIFVIDRVDAHPPQQTNADGTPAANLGQVVYMRRLNTYELENNFRSWEQAAARGAKPSLADGAVCIHPTTGHFHKYDAGSGTVEFVKASRNYFHGADIETDPSQPARWRNPYTSPSSPRGMLDFINAALLLNDPIKPFLNDATRNIHHEEDMHNGGYYTEGNLVRAADQVGLAEMRRGADVALAALDGLSHNKPFPAHDPALNHQVAVRDLMVSVIAGALRKPLKLIEIGADGVPVLEDGKPKVVGDFTRTWDGVEMKFDKPGPTMVGVGPDGFHAMGYHDGVLTCAPVRIDGDGATPGNLLHAILAPADTGGQRYSFAAGAVRSADAGMARLATRRDEVRNTSRQLFDKLINFAHADYVPLQSWLSTQAGGRPYARPAA